HLTVIQLTSLNIVNQTQQIGLVESRFFSFTVVFAMHIGIKARCVNPDYPVTLKLTDFKRLAFIGGLEYILANQSIKQRALTVVVLTKRGYPQALVAAHQLVQACPTRL